jgi:hypothetical protein
VTPLTTKRSDQTESNGARLDIEDLGGKDPSLVPLLLAVVSSGGLQVGILTTNLGGGNRDREPRWEFLDVDVDPHQPAPIIPVILLGLLADTDENQFEQLRLSGHHSGDAFPNLILGAD